jgi:hypothetical protein
MVEISQAQADLMDDGGQTVDELAYNLLPHDRAHGPGGPAAALIADAAEAGLVLKQQSQTSAGGQLSQPTEMPPNAFDSR